MKILVVEDDDAIARALIRVLVANGHRPMLASSMAECPRAVVKHSPHLVILDLGLPDVEGTETLEAMQGLVDHNVPIIVFSAAEVWKDECVRLGCSEFLLKGEFTPIDLPEAIDRAVNRHKLARALDHHDAVRNGDISYSSAPKTDPVRTGDKLLSLAAELKMAAVGG